MVEVTWKEMEDLKVDTVLGPLKWRVEHVTTCTLHCKLGTVATA